MHPCFLKNLVSYHIVIQIFCMCTSHYIIVNDNHVWAPVLGACVYVYIISFNLHVNPNVGIPISGSH